MTQATDADIKELKDLILGLDKKINDLDRKVDLGFNDLDRKVDLGFAEIKGEIKRIDAQYTIISTSVQKIPDLAEKVGELKNWRQIAIVIFTATVSGVITWFVRGDNNP